jgi:hypothetical protein
MVRLPPVGGLWMMCEEIGKDGINGGQLVYHNLASGMSCVIEIWQNHFIDYG